MDIPETLNKETASAAKRVINLLANLRVDQSHHCFYDMTRREVFAQIILRGSGSFQEIFKSITLNITIYVSKHKRIKFIHNFFQDTCISNLQRGENVRIIERIQFVIYGFVYILNTGGNRNLLNTIPTTSNIKFSWDTTFSLNLFTFTDKL